MYFIKILEGLRELNVEGFCTLTHNMCLALKLISPASNDNNSLQSIIKIIKLQEKQNYY